MAKAPLAKAPDAPRPDRRTRIASGPAPMPPPASSNPRIPKLPPELANMSADATIPAPSRAVLPDAPPVSGGTAIPTAPPASRGTAVPTAPPVSGTSKTVVPTGGPSHHPPLGTEAPSPSIKRTQMMMGAPPVPIPPAPKKVAPAAKAVPPAPTPDPSLPSHQETVIGPAPAPPTASPAPPPVAAPTASPAPAMDESESEAMFDGGLFDDDFGDDFATAIHAPETGLADAAKAARPNTPPPGLRDTLPSPDGNASTNPPAGPSMAAADTVPRLPSDPGAETSGRRPTTSVRSTADRSEKAGTQMHGTEGLSAPAADAPKLRLIPGKTIPGTRYQIERWLGEGGMGVVYEVSHVDIERRSALKILRFDLSQQPQMAQVFRDEARAASRLGSPHIVEVYDFGELTDGRLFFAMELLEGIDLVPADETTSMEPGRLIGILRQVCKGLDKAHEAGVVHRDVKPENIIVTDNDGRSDAVKIVDFGISAMLAAGERRAGIAGTPHYMAPEQILGDDFDGRLDIYALGCTAYELMVGMPPFDAEEVEDILKLQLHEPPMSPSERRPDLSFPPQLEAVVMRCLAKSPQERFTDMADLEAALCEAQIAAGLVTGWDDLPVPALPDTERYERIVAGMPSTMPVMEAKRSWLWPVVAGTSTLAAVGLGAFLMFGRQPTDEDKDQVEQVVIEARDAASKLSWVIPPPNLDTDATALIKVEELEGIEGSAERLADERAEELRGEFATTLVSHGDGLWDQARDLSRQYYIWALMFDPDNGHALDRANIDIITLDGFRKRALAGEYNEVERLIAGVAALGVVEDEAQKAEITDAVQEKMEDADAMAPQALASLERGASKAGVQLPKTKRGSGVGGNRDGSSGADGAGADGGGSSEKAGDPSADDDGDLVIDEGGEEVDPDAEGTNDTGRRKRRQKVNVGLSEGKGKRDPARSRDLTQQADAKRKKGLRNEAKTLYGQAIAANPGNGEAHLGLALVHFDQGSYHKCRKSAQKATSLLPRSGKAFKTLGDAYYKELEFHDALAAYKRAQQLGVNVKSRIADVEKKLGK